MEYSGFPLCIEQSCEWILDYELHQGHVEKRRYMYMCQI